MQPAALRPSAWNVRQPSSAPQAQRPRQPARVGSRHRLGPKVVASAAVAGQPGSPRVWNRPQQPLDTPKVQPMAPPQQQQQQQQQQGQQEADTAAPRPAPRPSARRVDELGAASCTPLPDRLLRLLVPTGGSTLVSPSISPTRGCRLTARWAVEPCTLHLPGPVRLQAHPAGCCCRCAQARRPPATQRRSAARWAGLPLRA